MIIIENYYSYTEGIHWTYKLLCFSTSYCIFQLIISIYFLAVTKKPRGFDHFQDPVNHIAKVECYMLLSAGLIMFAFPEQAMIGLTGVNESHKSLCRTCGAILFSLSFESFCLSEFVWIKDKKTFMLSRLVVSIFDYIFFIDRANFWFCECF